MGQKVRFDAPKLLEFININNNNNNTSDVFPRMQATIFRDNQVPERIEWKKYSQTPNFI